MEISGKKIGKLAFEINQDAYTYTLDAPESVGGEGKGPSPKGLLLSSLIGCTGIDVAMILGKMRVEIQDLKITAQTELTDEQPSVFKEITLSYRITGDEKDIKKIKRAVSMSMETYCGVSAMLEKHSPIIHNIYLNGREV
nr:OsmC family protein [uncultured Desulfobacter sp.]